MVHKRATKYGYSNRKLRDGADVPVCPDCENYPSTMDIGLCYPTHPHAPVEKEDVFLLQTGVSMYFTFAKMVIIFLVIRFLVVDIYNVAASAGGHFCSQYALSHTKELCALTLSGYNLKSVQDQGKLNVLDILNLLLTVLSIVYFAIYRKLVYKLQNWLDYNDVNQ